MNPGREAGSETLFLEDRYYTMLQAIVRDHLPGRVVWVFGSRAVGKNVWRYSDVDLAVEGSLSFKQTCAISEAFEESLLPVTVDILGLDDISSEFRERIRPDLVPLEGLHEQAASRAAEYSGLPA